MPIPYPISVSSNSTPIVKLSGHYENASAIAEAFNGSLKAAKLESKSLTGVLIRIKKAAR